MEKDRKQRRKEGPFCSGGRGWRLIEGVLQQVGEEREGVCQGKAF